MDIFEFELRYIAYKWLNNKFDLWRDEDLILKLVQITNRWKADKKIQDITLEEIHTLTEETYTEFKQNFIQQHKEYTL